MPGLKPNKRSPFELMIYRGLIPIGLILTVNLSAIL